MSSTTSVRGLFCLAAGLGLLCFLPTRSFSSETTHSIALLTPNERMHLPDSTSVKLQSGRVTTLGALRAEHRARMERFSQAGQWGKQVAARMPKPTPVPGLSAAHAAGPGAKQGSSALPHVTAAGPTQQKPSSGAAAKGNTGPVNNEIRVQPHAVTNATSATSASAISVVPMNLVPRQTYNVPIPKDYTAFCNAAQASACVYLPPNTTVTADYNGNPPNGNLFVVDVDPLITDSATCASLGGSLDSMQQCVFKYFSIQQTNFKYPGGTANWSYDCDPGNYRLDVKAGMVSVNVGFTTGYTTGAKPFDCMIQLWFNQ